MINQLLAMRFARSVARNEWHDSEPHYGMRQILDYTNKGFVLNRMVSLPEWEELSQYPGPGWWRNEHIRILRSIYDVT
jgi:hypothetical protein